MISFTHTGTLAARTVAVAVAVAVASGAADAGERAAGAAQAGGASGSGELVQATPPPFSPGIFPCSQCHDGGGDPSPRTLAFHEEIQARLTHGSPRHWCFHCHDLADRDKVHLSSGALLPFTQSYLLCAQCHYDKYRDWQLGIHGKRIGRWDGAKTYLLCVNCHDPHAPRIEAIAPMPRPARPMETRR